MTLGKGLRREWTGGEAAKEQLFRGRGDDFGEDIMVCITHQEDDCEMLWPGYSKLSDEESPPPSQHTRSDDVYWEF